MMCTAVACVCVLDRESHPTACFPFGSDLAPSPLTWEKKVEAIVEAEDNE
jgi:hypothetical protein